MTGINTNRGIQRIMIRLLFVFVDNRKEIVILRSNKSM